MLKFRPKTMNMCEPGFMVYIICNLNRTIHLKMIYLYASIHNSFSLIKRLVTNFNSSHFPTCWFYTNIGEWQFSQNGKAFYFHGVNLILIVLEFSRYVCVCVSDFTISSTLSVASEVRALSVTQFNFIHSIRRFFAIFVRVVSSAGTYIYNQCMSVAPTKSHKHTHTPFYVHTYQSGAYYSICLRCTIPSYICYTFFGRFNSSRDIGVWRRNVKLSEWVVRMWQGK